MLNPLPYILTFFTRKTRDRVDIVWSSKSWTYNIFRLYELLFWRRSGIRPEMTSKVFYENGRKRVLYVCHSMESIFALIETYIRELLAWKVPKVIWIAIPALQPVGGLPIFNSPFRFAIALDVASNGTQTTTSPITWSHTVTGSNPILAVGIGLRGSSPTATGMTYNSVSGTKARADACAGTVSGSGESSVWLKGNPSTGANTISVTATGAGTNGLCGGATSYSGAQSSNTADAVGGTSFTSTGAKTFNVTTVANNCWAFATGSIAGGTTPSFNTPTQTSRWSVTLFGNANSQVGQDNNAAKTPAGAISFGWTAAGTSSSSYCGALTGASFAPASAAVNTGKFFSFM